MEAIAIKCSNFHINTGLYLKREKVKETITQFVLNTVFHHVGLSWIISSNKEMKYDTKINNHNNWLNKGPYYNTDIYYKLHGTAFEDYIRNDRTNRYNIMCYITAHDKLLPTYVYDERSGGGGTITKIAITAES